jgi:hypothetical protein
MTVVDPAHLDTDRLDRHGLDTDRWLVGVPFSRLLRIHLRIWLEQRSMTAGTALTMAIGLLVTGIAVTALSAPVTTAAVAHRFASSAQLYVMAWLAIGTFAGAAPFRSRWAAMVLALAPRRTRWLAACYGSVLAWALAATAAFTVLAGIVTAVSLAHSGRPVWAALGTVTSAWQLAIAVSVDVTVGFCLGAATRGTALTLLTCYVALPLSVVWWGKAGPWIDLDAARNVISHLAITSNPAPVISALCLWVAGPAVLAAVRLRRSDVR